MPSPFRRRGTASAVDEVLELHQWQKKGKPPARVSLLHFVQFTHPALLGAKESFALCGERPKAPPLESATL